MRILSLQEVLVRSAFDANVTLTRENYTGIVGQISLAERDAKCQLLRVKGPCGCEFQRGWLVSVVGDKEVLLGGDCGNNHFGLDKFKAESRALEKQLDLADMRVRLEAHLRDEMFRRNLAMLDQRYRAIEGKVSALRKALPGRICLRLIHLAPQSRVTAEYRVEYVEEDKVERKVTRKLELRKTRPIVGLSIFTTAPFSQPQIAIQHCARALDPMDGSLDRQALKKRLKAITGLESVASQIEAIESMFAAFSTLENLTLVSLLATKQEERIDTVKLALQRSAAPATDRDARRHLDQLATELARPEGGRRVIFG